MKYDILVSKESVEKTMQALTERGHLPEFIESRAQALARIKELIPTDASVMNGSSRTLEEIGFVQYLKDGEHGWNNLHEAILSEKDPAAQAISALRLLSGECPRHCRDGRNSRRLKFRQPTPTHGFYISQSYTGSRHSEDSA